MGVDCRRSAEPQAGRAELTDSAPRTRDDAQSGESTCVLQCEPHTRSPWVLRECRGDIDSGSGGVSDDQPKVWSAGAATSEGAAAAGTYPMAVLGRACGVRLPLRIVEGVICALRVSHHKQTAHK